MDFEFATNDVDRENEGEWRPLIYYPAHVKALVLSSNSQLYMQTRARLEATFRVESALAGDAKSVEEKIERICNVTCTKDIVGFTVPDTSRGCETPGCDGTMTRNDKRIAICAKCSRPWPQRPLPFAEFKDKLFASASSDDPKEIARFRDLHIALRIAVMGAGRVDRMVLDEVGKGHSQP